MPRLVSRHRAGGMAAVLVCLIGASMVPEAGAQEPPRTYDQALVDRWMTELSNWGRWGKDDELGTLNLITPEKRLQAAAVKEELAARLPPTEPIDRLFQTIVAWSRYAELFTNIDLPKRLLRILEKDPEFRPAIIRALARE